MRQPDFKVVLKGVDEETAKIFGIKDGEIHDAFVPTPADVLNEITSHGDGDPGEEAVQQVALMMILEGVVFIYPNGDESNGLAIPGEFWEGLEEEEEDEQ
nr:MAG TPA: hypothetical protein [Caudoviricetes sp.]